MDSSRTCFVMGQHLEFVSKSDHKKNVFFPFLDISPFWRLTNKYR